MFSNFSHLPRRRTMPAWIAVLAILFSALAPSWAFAITATSMASQPGWSQALADICRADNAGTSAAHAGATLDQSPHDKAVHGSAHCPFCTTHASPALPPAPVAMAIMGGHDQFPRLYYQAPTPLFSWVAAQPRGPPALS